MSHKNLVEVGFCTRPHGIKGGFIFHLENADESIVKKGLELVLKPKNKSSELTIEGKRFKVQDIRFGNKVVAYLEGVINRNQVESLIPFSINILREHFPDVDSDEVYLADLLSFTVIDEETKNIIGTVEKFYDHGAQTNIVVKTFGEEIDIPFIGQFIIHIDQEHKKIFVNLPEYTA